MSWREVDGAVIALDLESSTYVTTNETGTLLWPHLAEGTTTRTLVSTLVDEYELDVATAEADVGHFLKLLLDAGLLEQP